MLEVRLFQLESSEITILVDALIEQSTGDLLIRGNDHGSRVEELTGDIDYEYFIRIKRKNKHWLLKALAPTARSWRESTRDRLLLEAVAARFSHNSAFSELLDYCNYHSIPYEKFVY